MAEKKTHKEAGYRTKSPFRGKFCGNCTMFRVSKGTLKEFCTAVVGPIDYDGWCALYEPKGTEKRAA